MCKRCDNYGQMPGAVEYTRLARNPIYRTWGAGFATDVRCRKCYASMHYGQIRVYQIDTNAMSDLFKGGGLFSFGQQGE